MEAFPWVDGSELDCQAGHKDTFLDAELRNVLVAKALELYSAGSAHHCGCPLEVGHKVGRLEMDGSADVVEVVGIEKEVVNVVSGNVLEFCFFPPSRVVAATSVSSWTFAPMYLLEGEGATAVLG